MSTAPLQTQAHATGTGDQLSVPAEGLAAHAQKLAAGLLHLALVGYVLREADHLLAQARLVQYARLHRVLPL